MKMGLEEKLPAIAMLLLQCVYAIMALINRAALVKGMSPRVFIFYRQAIATLVISPFAFLTSGKSSTSSMGVRSFLLIFVTAFIGVLLNQTIYFEGLLLATSSIASAMSNLVPAVTFITAAVLGMEQVNVRKLRSIAKILGTVFCVGGAVSMALLKGPKLLNVDQQLPYSSNSLMFQSLGGADTWLIGCLFLFGSMCCWSFWLILQVPISACYPDHISLSAWMCFLAMLQAGAVALFFERDPQAWNLSSKLELTCCFFSGIFGSGIQFFVQSWCVSRRGPVFSAMFNPLCTVITEGIDCIIFSLFDPFVGILLIITTVLACLFLHEQIYIGSLIGGIIVIIGLYTVLWGKSKELKTKLQEAESENKHQVKTNSEADLEQPLLIQD